MNRFEQQLKKEAENIRLTHAEKASMRLRLEAAMSAADAPAASPYFSYSFQFVRATRYALAALLMVAFVGGGTVSAASQALPGDWLYAVKTEVNERVELAWADSVKEEAEVEARLAERRVAEAEALEAEGRLDEETAQDIETRFDTHASRAVALVRGDSAKNSAGAAARTLVFTSEAQPEEGSANESFMATVADDADVAPASAPAAAKFEAATAVEAELGSVDELLDEQRERLARIKERLMERRKEGAQGRIEAATVVETPLLEAGATSTAEVSETTPEEPEAEDEKGEAEEADEQEEPEEADGVPLKRIIEKTLPSPSNLGL